MELITLLISPSVMATIYMGGNSDGYFFRNNIGLMPLASVCLDFQLYSNGNY
jgi:hypothetical protein